MTIAFVSRRQTLVAAAMAVTMLVASCGSDTEAAKPDVQDPASPTASAPWPAANMDLAGSRTALDSPIDSSNVADLEVAWTFDVGGESIAGVLATTPVIVDGVVWVADLYSNVYGLDLETGDEVLRIQNESNTFGPNGVAVGDGAVFVAPDNKSIAAYDIDSGEQRWRNEITELNSGSVNIQPVLAGDQVLAATSSLGRAGSRGTLFALDARTGAINWSFDTIESPDQWGNPDINAGGGAWFPPAVDLEEGRVYWGTANPYPWPGLPDFPNGSSRPGDNRWTVSTLALDLASGELVWGHQHRPHDLFDLDSSLTALAEVGPDDRQLVIASGKFGRVVALDPASGDVVWNTPVGTHQNDDLQSFTGEITVYPGYLGGVTTPMAIADDVVYVAAVNAPTELPAPAIDFDPESPNFQIQNGEMVAVDATDGSVVWDVEVDGQPFGGATVVNDLVLGSTLTGEVFALNRSSGETVWSEQLDVGVNGWPAVAGDTIILPAGVSLGEGPARIIAYRLPATSGSTTVGTGTD